MSFATTDDLAVLLGVTFNATETIQAQLALDLATARIRGYTRQQITSVTGDEVVLDGDDRHMLLLPEIPVIDVTDVAVGDDSLTVEDDVYWYADGRLYRTSGTWGSIRQSVTVTYDHGYTTVPDIVRDICLACASRLLSNPELLKQESIGSYSRTYAGEGFTDLELGGLDEYRLRGLT